MLGVKEMRITHEAMLDIFYEHMTRKLLCRKDVIRPVRITQNSKTKDFIIAFEDENKVKSILPPLEE